MLQDTAAFSSLVGMHQGKVRGFLLRLSSDYDLTNDLAQETFITAFEKISQFEGKNSISGWLMKIAFNQFLQSRRRDNRRDEINEEFKVNAEIQESYYEAINPEQLDLEVAMTKLTPEQSAAITLCHSYGFSHREAAEILEIPVGTVKTNILRGREQLQLLLQSTSAKAHSA